MKGQEVLFMLKLDGLTTKLIEDGKLIQASTRGDGEVGEDITHNIRHFSMYRLPFHTKNVWSLPVSLLYQPMILNV